MRGRIRSIKPEAHDDEHLWDLEERTGLPLFRGFTGLWNYADREGRFEWRPRTLKSKILPYWDGQFDDVLDALASEGFVIRYEVDGRSYGWLPNFNKHQAINNREEPSVLPEPPPTTRARRVPDACPTREARALGDSKGKGREGKGREWERNGKDASQDAPPNSTLEVFDLPIDEPPKTQRDLPTPKPEPKPRAQKKPGANFAPDDWRPNERHIEHAHKLGVKLETEQLKFTCHEFREKRTDWDKAFTGWLTRAAQYGTSSGARPWRPDDDPERVERGRRGLDLLYGRTPVQAKVMP